MCINQLDPYQAPGALKGVLSLRKLPSYGLDYTISENALRQVHVLRTLNNAEGPEYGTGTRMAVGILAVGGQR